MIADTIEFDTRTVVNKFTVTGKEYQLTININGTGEWTVFGWSTPQSKKTIAKSTALALRAIEVFYNSQPSRMYNPKITYAKSD